MTISSETRVAGPFTGTGLVSTYAFAFKAFSVADVAVTWTSVAGVDSALVYGTGYTVALNADQDASPGGTVTYCIAGVPTNLPSGEKLTITTAMTYTQGTQLNNGSTWYPKVVEYALDRLVSLVQQLKNIGDRAMRIPITDGTTAPDLPNAATRANKFLGFDASGNPMAATAVTGSPASSAMLPVIQASTLANGRNALGLGTLATKSIVATADITDGNVTLSKLQVSAGGAPSILVSPTTGTQFAEYQLLAQSFQFNGTTIGAPRSAMKRQCPVTGARDANGQPSFITTGTGLAPGLSATATPLCLSFAQGWNSYGPRDNPVRLSADVAGIVGNLPANQTSIITATYVDFQTVTWSYTFVPDQDGDTFDRTRQSLLHFEQNGSTPLDDYGMTWALNGGAVINNTKPAYGSFSLNLSGGTNGTTNAKGAFTTDFTSFPADSWEWSGVFNFDTVSNTTNNQILLGAVNNTGYGASVTCYNSKLAMYLSSTGSGFDIAGTPALGSTTIAANTWYRVRMVFDHLGGTYKLYLSTGGTGSTPSWGVETLEQTVTSSLRICPVTRMCVGVNYNGAFNNGMSGYVDEVRFLPCTTGNSTQTPAGFPLSPAAGIYWYSPLDGLMYAVTSASTTAGTNPGMTAVNLLCLADVETGASAVSLVRCRPYNGRYRSAPFSIPAVTVVNMSHNMGTTRCRGRLVARTNGLAATPTLGCEDESFANYSTGTYFIAMPPIGYNRRNTFKAFYHNAGNIAPFDNAGTPSWNYVNNGGGVTYIAEYERSY